MREKLIAVAVFLAGMLQLKGQEVLFTGGWSTNNNGRFTVISSGNVSSKIYRINAVTLVDSDVLEFTIFVDNIPLKANFYEGSSVCVEGKNIAIQQNQPGTLVKGEWSVVQEVSPGSEKIFWSAYPRLNKDIMVASLKSDQEFVLSMDLSSVNCSATGFVVLIDGVPLKDKNNLALVFAPGSSIYSRGKEIVLRATGNCSGSYTVNGNLKLKKIP